MAFGMRQHPVGLKITETGFRRTRIRQKIFLETIDLEGNGPHGLGQSGY